jgi:hypothetical protein
VSEIEQVDKMSNVKSPAPENLGEDSYAVPYQIERENLAMKIVNMLKRNRSKIEVIVDQDSAPPEICKARSRCLGNSQYNSQV